MCGWWRKMKSRWASPAEPFLITGRTRDRVHGLIEGLGDEAIVVNIGAGRTRLAPKVLNVDIYNSGTTDVLASALALPFPDGVADLVILQGVLEHVGSAHRT